MEGDIIDRYRKHSFRVTIVPDQHKTQYIQAKPALTFFPKLCSKNKNIDPRLANIKPIYIETNKTIKKLTKELIPKIPSVQGENKIPEPTIQLIIKTINLKFIQDHYIT